MSRSRRLIPLAVCAGLAPTACGSSSGPASIMDASAGAPGVGTGGALAGTGGAFTGTGGVGGAPDGTGGVPAAAGTLSGDASLGSGGSDAGVPPNDVDGSADGAVVGLPIPEPVPVGCVTDVTPGVHDFPCNDTIDTVSVPEQCTRTACGIIVDVHGGMMSSQMEDKNTNLRALGGRYGYIVIQPNALQNFLLLNQRLFVPDAPGAPADDTRVMDILKQVIEAFHADTNRIHMTGFSEGGYMTWRWLCAHSDLLASVAPGAAGWQCANLANLGLTPPEVGCEMTGSSVPARSIPVLYMQGMKDGLVDPDCADSWIRANVLTALELGSGTTIGGDPDFQSAEYVRTRYENPQGVPFEYIQHQYTSDSAFLGVGIVGHCYPGSTDLTVTPPAQTVIPPDQLMAFGCKGQTEFNWGEEVIQFFIAHPKQ